MRAIGSFLFLVISRGVMIFNLFWMWIVLPFGWRYILVIIRAWTQMTRVLLRVLCGLSDRFDGVEKIPDGPVIIAVKHQSEWETFIIHLIRKDPSFVLKKELTDIPMWGFYARKTGNISVDRDAGTKALKDMTIQAKAAVKAGRSIIIFPEGTRLPVGQKGTYHPGVASLYKTLGIPVVPVALNSGLFWPTHTYLKRPGTIVLEVQDPILPGLDRQAFMTQLEESIETASQRLIDDARTIDPTL